MLFSSMTFISLFLPIVLGIYYLLPKIFRNGFLLCASLIFYGWNDPKAVLIILSIISISYIGAILMSQYPTYKKIFLIGAILLNLEILLYYKYFNFILTNLNAAFNLNLPMQKIIMPIGISFYTFQALSYLTDVFRQTVPAQKNPFKLALYISLFPQLIAGPIIKYHDISAQLNFRSENLQKIIYGFKRFIIGLSKKVLIANTMGSICDQIFSQPVTQYDYQTAWLGTISYSLQLYYDFSGYSDMAIGLGMMFGFKFMENFNYPYCATSISDFWHRWHISLSTWFKEYLYITLGGNHGTSGRTYLNLFIVFLITGIWHGAEWTFIVWGLWHGLFIIFEKITGWNKPNSSPYIRLTQHFYTILVFSLGWVFFRSPNLSYGYEYIRTLFGLQTPEICAYDILYYLDTTEFIALFFGLLFTTPIARNILNKPHISVNISLIILFILSISSIAASSYNPFIYFRF